MNVIIIEDSAFKQMVGMFETIQKTVVELATENKKLKDNRLMDISETMEYTGFGKTWVTEHKAEMGYVQIGNSPLRFYKEDVDAFMKKNFKQSKIKQA